MADRRHRQAIKVPCAVLAAILLAAGVDAHPSCISDSSPPSLDLRGQLSFCTEVINSQYGSCCDAGQENQAKAQYYDGHQLSDACKPFQQQVACGVCGPFSIHNYRNQYLELCWDFCHDYVSACGNDLGLPADYCQTHASSDTYCYPVNDQLVKTASMNKYFNNNLNLPSRMVGMFPKPGSNKWWILDQSGSILEVDNSPDAGYTTRVLDLTGTVNTGGSGNIGELGLLGLAFSPDFQTTGYFYVNYVDWGRNTVIARFKFDSNNVGATAGTQVKILTFKQPYDNHNGGTLLFSPKDLSEPTGRSYYDLYIPTGDGGSGNNPEDTAQNRSSLLGKVLRIRLPTNSDGYTIPDDNLQNEVWAYGFRNPFRCSFDRAKDAELWCGDVGQDNVEKITRAIQGANHGWRNYEGTRFQYCHSGVSGPWCDGKPFTGDCVIGGYVYRGSKYADVYGGNYIFADYQQGRIVRMYRQGDGWQSEVIVQSTGWLISSLAQDSNGELYIIRYGNGGNVYELPAKLVLTNQRLVRCVAQGADMRGVSITANGGVNMIDTGDSVLFKINVASADKFKVVYTLKKAMPDQHTLSLGLVEGQGTCEGAMDGGAVAISNFNTNGKTVTYRATDIALDAGQQSLTLCFRNAAFVDLTSICLGDACRADVDARASGGWSNVADPACENGVTGGGACCPLACGKCTGIVHTAQCMRPARSILRLNFTNSLYACCRDHEHCVTATHNTLSQHMVRAAAVHTAQRTPPLLRPARTAGCDKRAGGDASCCHSRIKASGRVCTGVGAPCIMPGRRLFESDDTEEEALQSSH
ncbi:Sorbosone dehydrogenase-domain-containing protein [Tribonema minus]|uniref:Sorbosone dehydrogenase-domain-containing protein n=1 Tax=Tribonema minus TaxID=303371 RepID=A0A835Z9U7_9STRA|nr:Sorbosone dehydrogenase-domain-containing protein [Tribonema minus]